MDELTQLQIIDELVAGVAVIIERAVYNTENNTAKAEFYAKRLWHPTRPEIKLPEPADKCAVELRHLVGTGKFKVNIDDESWFSSIRVGAAREREFSVVQDILPTP